MNGIETDSHRDFGGSQAGNSVAIVGMGCRLPGAPDPESFWRVLIEGRETVGEYPMGRNPYMDQVFVEDAVRAGRVASLRGGFLPDLDCFDAAFFSLSPREAALLDPQQRLLLELAWEAFEDAGLVRQRYARTRTGVFIGMWTSDYEQNMHESLPKADFYSTTGGGRYAASGRLAYFFDLRGPNLTLDTACSSSLVAIHLACRSLWSGESEMALAGGVNVILRPEVTLSYSSANMLSPAGRCKFGDASADGYIRSEGAALLVMKTVSRALADGDRIYAVVRGTGVNNDGKGSGLLISPSANGQVDMLRLALADAGVAPEAVDYIEAHGTGTPTGDPVEIGAIGRLMRESGRTRPCYIGSAKTNIGHTESAAGAAGVIKVALALHHGVIPASLHFHDPNPKIPWTEIPVRIAAEVQPWPEEGSGIAGVSAFGITGTNAHIVLERAPSFHGVQSYCHRPHIVTFSGHTETALTSVARNCLEAFEGGGDSLRDMAYTATVRRTHLEYRLAVVARDRSELQKKLSEWLAGNSADGVRTGKAASRSQVGFIFPGQGGQWVGMGRQLWESESVFRRRMEECDAAIRGCAGWSVIERVILNPDPDALGDIDVVQPALWAFMVSLAELWRSWGVEPVAVVGHSMGEAAAAVVAGALPLEDGAAVICERSRLMRQTSGRGAMAVAELASDEAEQMAATYDGRVSVAAINSPSSIVFSGDAGAVEELVTALQLREIFARMIKVDVASHSRQMDPIRNELERRLCGLVPRDGTIPLYSTTSGRVESGGLLDAAYWGRNLREPVKFAAAVKKMVEGGCDAFIELSPHPVLLDPVQQSLDDAGSNAIITASVRRESNEQAEMLAAVGALHAGGYPIDFGRLYSGGRIVRLPPYSWEREHHWIEAPRRRNVVQPGGCAVSGRFEAPFAPGTSLWTAQIDDTSLSIAEVLVEAGLQLEPARSVVFENLRFQRRDGEFQLVLVAAREIGLNSWELSISAGSGEGNKILGTGTLSVAGSAAAQAAHAWKTALAGAFEAACQAEGIGDAEARVSGIARLAVDAAGKAKVEGLTAEGRVFDTASILYRLCWRRYDSPPKRNAPGSFIVVSDDAEAAERLAVDLRANGQDAMVLDSKPTGVRLPQGPVESVICLLTARRHQPESTEELLAFELEALGLIPDLVRQICNSNSTLPSRLWLVTSGAIGPDQDANFAAASLWGLGRVIGREHPELRCTNVDLDPVRSDASWKTLTRLLLSDVTEDQLAIRGCEEFIPRYQQADRTDQAAVIRTDCTYLISGGTGGIGRELAKWLVRKGARHLALIARRPPDTELRKALEEMGRSGAELRWFCADVADAGQVNAVIAEIGAGMPLIKGVFHLAAVSEAALIRDINHVHFPRALASKALGAWNLHHATEAIPLDHFVLFSSIAAVWSQPGQGTYAAANAILDGLSRYRRSIGLPAMSLQWGGWCNVGLARTEEVCRSIRVWVEEGIRPITADTGFAALELALGLPDPVLLASPLDLRSLGKAVHAGRLPTAFSGLTGGFCCEAQVDAEDIREVLRRAAPGRVRLSMMTAHLRKTLSTVLKTSAARIDPGRPMGSMGVDSLMALEFVRRLSKQFGVKLPATAVFNYPTIENLGGELLRRLNLDGAVTNSSAVAAPFTADLCQVDVSEEEALRALRGHGA